MHPDPLTRISTHLARWAARQDDPDRALPTPTPAVCALRLTSAIMETGGASAGEDLAALWHHVGRPPLETFRDLDGRRRRVVIIAAGPIAAWTIHEDLTFGGLSISSHHLIEIAAALGAASMTTQTTTLREALAAFASTLPAR